MQITHQQQSLAHVLITRTIRSHRLFLLEIEEAKGSILADRLHLATGKGEQHILIEQGMTNKLNR